MRKLLQDKRGSSAFYVIFIILGLLVMFGGFFEYFKVIHIAKEYRREVQLCLDSYTMKVGAEGKPGVRDIEVKDLKSDFLNYYNNYMGESNKYTASQPDLQYEVIDNAYLKMVMTVDLTIPIYFGSVKATEIELNLDFLTRFRFKV